MKGVVFGCGVLVAAVCSPANAQSARDILLQVAYNARDKPSALAGITQALHSSEAAMKRDPRDVNARLQHALAISYRGSLNRSRADVMAARRGFEAIVAADPRNPDAQLALAGWHLGAVIELGPMMARTVLGARTATGRSALDRALALGGDRASIPLLASLHVIQVNPNDIVEAKRLAERAIRANAGTAFDRLLQKQASSLLAALNNGNGRAAAATAKLMMPFGRLTK